MVTERIARRIICVLAAFVLVFASTPFTPAPTAVATVEDETPTEEPTAEPTEEPTPQVDEKTQKKINKALESINKLNLNTTASYIKWEISYYTAGEKDYEKRHKIDRTFDAKFVLQEIKEKGRAEIAKIKIAAITDESKKASEIQKENQAIAKYQQKIKEQGAKYDSKLEDCRDSWLSTERKIFEKEVKLKAKYNNDYNKYTGQLTQLGYTGDIPARIFDSDGKLIRPQAEDPSE